MNMKKIVLLFANCFILATTFGQNVHQTGTITSVGDSPPNASLNSIIGNLGSEIATLKINRPVSLTANLIIPENISLELYNGAPINIGAYTLTINGPINAGAFQIFKGTGIVNGKPKITQALPQWWKDVSELYDWSSAIQKAVDFYPKVFFPELDISSTQAILNGYHVSKTIKLDLSKKGIELYGVGEGSLITNYFYQSSFSGFIFECTNIPDGYNRGLKFSNLSLYCTNGIFINGGDNFTNEEKCILNPSIKDCRFKNHLGAQSGTAISLRKVFDAEIADNDIDGFTTGILLQGSDLNSVHDNRIINFHKYAICDLAYKNFGSQNAIVHNDLLSFIGPSTNLGSFIKSNSRHIIIRDNYMENNNVANQLFAYVDCSRVGLTANTNYTDFSKNISITGNRCDIISNASTKHMYYICEKFKSLYINEEPNLNDNYTNGSDFGAEGYNESVMKSISLKMDYTNAWDKEINMVNCESFKGWDNFNTSKQFQHVSNGDIIIDSRHISYASNRGDYPMQTFNGENFLLTTDNSIFVEIDQIINSLSSGNGDLPKNLNVKIKIRNSIPNTAADDLYFAIKSTTTTADFQPPLFYVTGINLPDSQNYSIVKVTIPIPFPSVPPGYPTDRFDPKKKYYIQLLAKNTTKEIKEIIIENNAPIITAP